MITSFVMIKNIVGWLWLFVSMAWILINIAGWWFPALQENIDVGYRTISISLSQALRSGDFFFAVRHVRDGKDEIADHGPLLNEDIPFKAVDKSGKIQATVKYARKLGFQYKCYVDFLNSETFETTKQKLSEAGFEQISQDLERENRAWFLIKGKPAVETRDKEKFTNNYFYP
jgi:hypothetical protein